MFASKDTLLTRPSGYNIARSVRTRSSASGYFNRTLTTATNNKIWTWSAWVKRGTLNADSCLFSGGTTAGDANQFNIRFNSPSDTITMSSDVTNWRITSQVFRDPSAWYHFVLAVDTTQATAANRILFYINGVQVTAFSSSTNPTQNTTLGVNTASAHNLARRVTGSDLYFDGYLTEINFIDGQALTPSSFGETDSITGVWKPKAYSGTYGTNGFELNFSDNSNNTAATIGKDYSGNGNNWTPNNISVTAGITYDSMTDVPTLTSATAANYCVMNPLRLGGSGGATISGGNLNLTCANTGPSAFGTMGVTSGKFYWEVTVTRVATGGASFPGIGVNTNLALDPLTGSGSDPNGYMYLSTGNKYNNNTGTAYGASLAANDVVGVALDMDAGTITFYKNNTSQGQAFSGITGTAVPAFILYGTTFSNDSTCSVNFGQQGFTYTPPTGYVALNTYNLPASTITNGAAYMAATTYTGTGSSLTVSNAVGSTSFKPDLVWVKRRDGPQSHQLYDINRGVNQALYSNLTNAETTEANGLSAFTTSGFTVISDIGVNTSGGTYVGWNWKASNTTASNTNGTITSTVSANTTAGFSVVTYTGTGANATVGHGLGVAPSFIIIKNRSSALNWICYHASLGNGNAIFLNLTNASSADTAWNNTSPTSTVFSLGSAATNANGSGNALVAYCFAAVAGYSAFGSYTGNGSTDGTFVYTGFRPRFVMIKKTSGTDDWCIQDTARDPYNMCAYKLGPNSSGAENYAALGNTTENNIDILSNGFKLRSFNSLTNASGATLIYACFAENPFRNALAR